jgi:hypothetical protein
MTERDPRRCWCSGCGQSYPATGEDGRCNGCRESHHGEAGHWSGSDYCLINPWTGEKFYLTRREVSS